MTRPKIIDTIPFFNEFEVLTCRLTELYDVVDHFIVVEADITHQGAPKPYWLSERLDEFAEFKDKLIVVRASGLPTATEDPDHWCRELGQRDHVLAGIAPLDLGPDDIILHGDCDEIPRPLYARNIRPGRSVQVFGMRHHCHAIDWLHPQVWFGTTATTVRGLAGLGPQPFRNMRNLRQQVACPDHMRDAGWHLGWLGGPERAVIKAEAFLHPEVIDRVRAAAADPDGHFYWREGYHVHGEKLAPVDVDESWPRWVFEGNAPQSWYRPRQVAA